MHDLRYGNCQAFHKVKGRWGNRNLCEDATNLLSHHPENVVSDIIGEASDPEAFSAILKCKYIPAFIQRGINHPGGEGRTLLHRFALSCDHDGIVLARTFGAKEIRDSHGQTPADGLMKKVGRQELAVQLETNSFKAAALSKDLTKCKEALAALQKDHLALDDLKALSFSLDSKISVAEFGKREKTVLIPAQTSDRQPASN